MDRKGFLIDTSRCTACRSCQVACKQWNKLPAEGTVNRGSYENPPALSPHLYNQVRFIEAEKDGDFRWLFRNQRCMHCGEAGCLKVCPSAGALYRTPEGLVGWDREKCIGCNYCVSACPFDVPRYTEDKKVAKCHGCADRVSAGLSPACAKACPTGAIRFGDRDALIAGAKSKGKAVYGEKDLGGLGVVFVLDDSPGRYELPENPAIPASIFLWKDVIRPMGILGFWGAVGAALLHYVTVGPKRLEEDETGRDKGGEQP